MLNEKEKHLELLTIDHIFIVKNDKFSTSIIWNSYDMTLWIQHDNIRNGSEILPIFNITLNLKLLEKYQINPSNTTSLQINYTIEVRSLHW